MTSLDSSSLNTFELVSSFGFILAIIGVVGEGVEYLVKWTKKRKFRKAFPRPSRRNLVELHWLIKPSLLLIETAFFMLLVAGLILEYWGSENANRILARSNAELHERASMTESNNAALQFDLVKLKHGRIITYEQISRFKLLSQNLEKFPIKIIISEEGRDTETFAHGLRDMFTEAGFKTNTDAEPYGINHIFGSWTVTKVGVTNELADLFVLVYATNEVYKTGGGWTYLRTNGLLQPVSVGTNVLDKLTVLKSCLDQDDMTVDWHGTSDWIKPNEIAVLVPVK